MKAREREEFLLTEVKRAAEEMHCKLLFLLSNPCICTMKIDTDLSSRCSGIRLDPREEERRINARLTALSENVARYGSDFWSNRDRSDALALLKERVHQVGNFAATCTKAIERVHRALFPLNPVPQGLGNLMAKFQRGRAARR